MITVTAAEQPRTTPFASPMPEPAQPIERKLAAIFAADVAGYSRLMGQDEVGTLRTLAAHREIMDRLIARAPGPHSEHGRRQCARGVPECGRCGPVCGGGSAGVSEANEGVPEDRRMSFRIGVHVGDVMVRGGDLLGDGVNIAADFRRSRKPGVSAYPMRHTAMSVRSCHCRTETSASSM